MMIPKKFIHLFNSKQKNALESALKESDGPGDVLKKLGVAVPPELSMQWMTLQDFFLRFGADDFSNRINLYNMTGKSETQESPKKEIRVSKELPKLRLDNEATHIYRRNSKPQLNQIRQKTVEKAAVEPTPEVTPSQKSNEPLLDAPTAKKVPEEVTIKVPAVQAPIEAPTPQNEGMKLGEPTGDWDGITERRSGEERRKKSRRTSVDVIFKNKRYGKDRRSGEDRRKKK